MSLLMIVQAPQYITTALVILVRDYDNNDDTQHVVVTCWIDSVFKTACAKPLSSPESM